MVFTVSNVKLKGLAVCVPKQTEDNLQFTLLSEAERATFVNTVGIRYRKVAPSGITASDLCLAAAEKLLKDTNWNREEISVLIFVTQTPDYIIPNTSSILQHKLNLPKSCIAFDVNLGCSGYVYGLSIISGLLQNIPNSKGLLLVGDASTQTISMRDKSTAPLFSDAGTATALEFVKGEEIHFNLQTDGSEYDDIIVSDGGFRNKVTEKSFEENEYSKGVFRNNLQMKLDGVKIFNFALREIAPSIHALLEKVKIEITAIDYFLFHQANLLMLESVRKKLKAERGKVPYSLYDFGNTSSASIPITMITQLRSKLISEKLKLVLSGFGVGLSWGTAYLETEKIICSELVEI